jgi:hypothetical protein
MANSRFELKLLLPVPSAIWSTLQIFGKVREWGAHHPLAYRWSFILVGLNIAIALGIWVYNRWGGKVREWGKDHPIGYPVSLVLSGLSVLILAGVSIAFFSGYWSAHSIVAVSGPASAKPPVSENVATEPPTASAGQSNEPVPAAPHRSASPKSSGEQGMAQAPPPASQSRASQPAPRRTHKPSFVSKGDHNQNIQENNGTAIQVNK